MTMWGELYNWLQSIAWLFGGAEGLWVRAVIGAAGGITIAATAVRSSSLTRQGAVSAAIMGTGYTALGGLLWFGSLLVFFTTSSMLSRWKRKHRRKAEAELLYEKTGARDAGQVWANGGVGLALCAANAIWPHNGWLYAFIGVMAAVNADTWATELGSLSRVLPISIRTGKRVPAGTSGGITAAGSGAAAAGALTIGIFAGCAALIPGAWSEEGAAGAVIGTIVVTALLGGMLGAFVDSYLGAAVQVMYRCEVCMKETERALHCGRPASVIRGFRWLNNDAVNLLSSVAAGAAALVISQMIG
ncbi:DUF92 domain-containing protein [Paenibacillus xylaniclasticus]|uniref:DUF92 domain-containing protein n=1 Tax=Paenibacillus xylaniclasticus TaxID=588083 RepID=UPI000FDA9511|nr:MULTISPECIES: DUF92 domain-containing protein [Paenibacillus]GFN30215.1 hypothetical protein PCURB6_04750 [Paenibacillus curdlanolyticus]